MTTPIDHPEEPAGPVAQSLGIGFGVLRLATVALALFWASSNIRQVPPDAQAVVLRFGQVVQVRTAGLIVALPRPFEQVELLPRAERQLELPILSGVEASPALVDPVARANGETVPDNAGIYLTGDGGVMLMRATLTYRIDDAAAYFLASSHVAPALRRLFLSSAVTIAAARKLDDFLVVRAEHDDASAQIQREAMRGALVQEINRRLRVMGPDAGLGIEVTRADVTALLPPAAKFSFDAVLDAMQMAEQGLAAARTDSARVAQNAAQERDRILTAARASADERVGAARAHVAAITALEQKTGPASRPSLMDQLYRERIAGILRQAGAVNTIDMRGGNRLILPGGKSP